jgi:hypothetical protein
MDGAWSPNWMEQLFRQRSSARFILPLVLFCSVLFCSVLFCSVLFCSVLFCSVLFWRLADIAMDCVASGCCNDAVIMMLYGCYYVRD